MTKTKNALDKERGATAIEYGLVLGTLVIFVLIGMNLLSGGFNSLLTRVDDQNQLSGPVNLWQTYVDDNNLGVEYAAWTAAQNENPNDSWQLFVETEYPTEYAAWIESRNGFQVPPDGTVTDLTISQGYQSAELLWTPVTSPNGRAPRGYHIYIDGIRNGTAPPVSEAVSSIKIQHLVTELSPETTYSFYLRPYNNFGVGPKSNTQTITIEGDELYKPGKPQNLTTIAKSGEVRVSWTAPLSDGGNAITQYQVEVGPSNFVSGATVANIPISQTTTIGGVTKFYADIKGLTNDKTFTFAVKAFNGNVYGDPETVNAQPFEPYNVSALPTGIEPYITAIDGLTADARYAPETQVPGFTLNLTVPQSQVYRLHYQELWRKTAASPTSNAYVLRARLGDGTLLQEKYGTLDGAGAKDGYITWDTIVVLPAGSHIVKITLENLEAAGNLQGVRSSTSPATFALQDISHGVATKTSDTGQTLSPLPYGAEDYALDTNSGGVQQLTTGVGRFDMPGAGISVNPQEASTYMFAYSGLWRSVSNATNSEVVIYLYIDGVEKGIIARETLGNQYETISGKIIVPTLSPGTHTVSIKAQTLFDTAEYQNTATSPQILLGEHVSGSSPLIHETQVDISGIAYGTKDKVVSTAPVTLTPGATPQPLSANSLSFSSQVPGAYRTYLIGISLPASNGIANNAIVLQAKINGSSTYTTLGQAYFTSASVVETYEGYMLLRVPTGTSNTTIEFFASGVSGDTGTISMPASATSPIQSFAIDLGDS